MRPSELSEDQRERYYRLFLPPQDEAPRDGDEDLDATEPASGRTPRGKKHRGISKTGALILVSLALGCTAGWMIAYWSYKNKMISIDAMRSMHQRMLELEEQLSEHSEHSVSPESATGYIEDEGTE